MFKHILVPLSIELSNEKFLESACLLAKENGAKITFYHAIPPYFPSIMVADNVVTDSNVYDAFSVAVNKQAATLLEAAEAAAKNMAVPCATLSTLRDSPYEGIVIAATEQGCDLIFMSSHGRRGMSALLLGSETQKVLTHCKIPVLVYR